MSVKTFRDIYQGSTTSNGVTTSVRLGMLYQRWGYSDSSMESVIASCASISTGWGPGIQTAYGSDHPNTKEKIIAPNALTAGKIIVITISVLVIKIYTSNNLFPHNSIIKLE